MASTITVSLVFIDSAVDHACLISNKIPAEAERITLDANRDGLEQITEVLASRQEIERLYIVSPGSVSSLKLGSSYLTRFNLNRYGWQLQAWGEALAPDAKIVVHGCTTLCEPDLTLIQQLSLLTGAKVMLASHESEIWMLGSQSSRRATGLPAFEAAKVAL